MRKQALNPDQKKKTDNPGEGDLAKKAYYMSKFADILDDEEDENDESD